MHQAPCDLALQSYCTSAGAMYPWHAVRRFVRENQGLMRRMYGDQRHISVLRAEFEIENAEETGYAFDSDLHRNGEFKRRYAKIHHSDLDNELYQTDESEPRFLQGESKHEEILNSKFIFAEDPNLNIRLADLKSQPYFKPTTTQKTTTEALTPTHKTTDGVENTTDTTVIFEEGQFTSFTEHVTTQETTTDTTVDQITEQVSTESLKKSTEKLGEVLFQDMDEDSDEDEKPSKLGINYNLKGVYVG